jgi:hypothetical protein
MAYFGYLKPYEARIRELWAAGNSAVEIARAIYTEGARSPYGSFSGVEGQIVSMGGIIRKILFGYKRKPNRVPRLTARTIEGGHS